MTMRLIFATFALFVFFSCQSQVPLSELAFSGGKKVLFLDKTQAAEAITSDKTDRFFDRVTISEMSIQMKKAIGADWSRQMVVEDYKNFLRNDVVNFTGADTELLSDLLNEVYSTCNAVAPSLIPNNIRLIKTSAVHYGESVYYTRENCIVIPFNELNANNKEHLKHTLYHEIFHIISRQNPALRNQLYSLIGFRSFPMENLRLPATLAARVFFNPDGVNFAQVIDLTTLGGEKIQAIPVIYSKNNGFNPAMPNFFSYLNFELFQVISNSDGTFSVVTKADGVSSTLKINELPDYFRQIRNNTRYIIHPDEILADNFIFVMEAKRDPSSLNRYSTEGRELISMIEKTLISSESSYFVPMEPSNK